MPQPPSTRRALAILALALLLAGVLLLSLIWPGSGSSAPSTCPSGTVIDRASAVQDRAGAEHLFALVQPASAPNMAVGNEPGCQALYRSDDAGITWTAVFSATSEAPITLAGSDPDQIYLLTQAVHFPLYLAGNVYRSESLGAAWTWQRISPQDRHAVPNVAIAGMAIASGGAIVLRAANGDGAALLRSTDAGATWLPIVVPNLLAVNSFALLGNTIAVTPAGYAPGAPPGQVSRDGGKTWAALGPLPRPPSQTDLRPVLTAFPAEQALILELMPGNALGDTIPVVRYASRDDGRTWSRVECGAVPVAGCAALDRWSQTQSARYVLYHHRVFRAENGQAWQPLPLKLPAPAGTITQILARHDGQSDTLYLVTPTAIWQSQSNGTWRNIATSLAVGPAPLSVD